MRQVFCHRRRWSDLPLRTWTLITVYLASMVVTAQSLRDILGQVPIPQFEPGLPDVTARPGAEAILPCSVRHLGTKQVVWRDIRKDQFLTIGTMAWSGNPNVEVRHKRRPNNITEWNLVIKDVKPTDAGTYECQVTSRAGHHKHVTLSVVGPPITKSDAVLPSRSMELNSNTPNLPVTVCGAADMDGCLISITGKKWVDLGQKIELRCNASGGARVPDEIDWFKSGDKIDSEKYRRIIIDKYKSMADRSFISNLVIDRSSLNDTGDYICRSSRNDIANLKVTVLHGVGSVPNKRGTDQGGRNRYTQDIGGGTGSDVRATVLQTLCFSLLALYCTHMTSLATYHFGLYS